MSSNARFARRMLAAAAVLPLSLAIVLGGCNDEGGEDGGTGHHPSSDAGGEDGEVPDVPCTAEYPTYDPGMSVQAGELTITLVSALPAPPRQKLANDWTIEITDAAGESVSSVMISNPDSYMQVHGHYGARRPIVTEQDEPGQYLFDNIDFKMRGPWQVLFDVQSASGAKQPVRFNICVE